MPTPVHHYCMDCESHWWENVEDVEPGMIEGIFKWHDKDGMLPAEFSCQTLCPKCRDRVLSEMQEDIII